ncbi:DUF6527 family protein [Streptomyces sp. NBC_00365]|uniref:DUF6527 family protein n=1 Tax=Streptomyces sp. NBC_00365 TaxID=2975726 RepID=UPI00338F3A06
MPTPKEVRLWSRSAFPSSCGCGRKVVTPLAPQEWKLTLDGVSVSLHPSIGNWSFPLQVPLLDPQRHRRVGQTVDRRGDLRQPRWNARNKPALPPRKTDRISGFRHGLLPRVQVVGCTAGAHAPIAEGRGSIPDGSVGASP